MNKVRLGLMLVLLLASSSAIHAIEIEGFTHDSVVFRFSNARFVEYEGIESLSVDVEVEVRTTFLPRTVDFGALRLVAHDPDVEKQIAHTPSLFNSLTFGTIMRLTANEGKKVKDRSDLGDTPVHSIEVDSGKVHRGTLLFPLEGPYSMIVSLQYKGTRGAVRRARAEYINLQISDLNNVSVLNHLREVKIPTEGDMILLEVLKKMRDFESLNEPLKAAW